MVAEAKQPKPKPPKTELPKIERSRMEIWTAARSLYCRGYTPVEIAKALGILRKRVQNMAYHGGWAAIRRETMDKVDQATQDRLSADIAHEQAVIGAISADLTLRALQSTGERLTQGDDKGASMLAGTARNLAEVARRTRGLDKQASVEAPAAVSLNIFMCRPLPPEQAAIDVSATPALPS